MKVALSGDGADELFGGYYKHLAYHQSIQSGVRNALIQPLGLAASFLPNSRSSTLGNTARRIAKYASLLKLNSTEKYWRLASFYQDVNQLLVRPFENSQRIKDMLTKDNIQQLNQFLDVDLKLVLPGDMLTKVDLMSMANSLEVRVPFLDKDLVDFARSLPPQFKVSKNHRKRVLQDAFEYILPKELHHRSKKGFEVPMLAWLKNELNDDLTKTVFNYDFIRAQGLFKDDSIQQLEKQLSSSNPGDVHAILWTLYVFQKWYKKYLT